jgi:hypothetical protein
MLHRLQRDGKRRRQVVLSTHSEALLDNQIDGQAILRLLPDREGTRIVVIDAAETALLKSGLTPAEVIRPKTRPQHVDQLRLF